MSLQHGIGVKLHNTAVTATLSFSVTLYTTQVFRHHLR
jgi:hypothetical protein